MHVPSMHSNGSRIDQPDLDKICCSACGGARYEVPFIQLRYVIDNFYVLHGVACDAHSNHMKARKLKKSINLQQHSHARNVLETLKVVTGRSITASFNEIKKLESKRARKYNPPSTSA